MESHGIRSRKWIPEEWPATIKQTKTWVDQVLIEMVAAKELCNHHRQSIDTGVKNDHVHCTFWHISLPLGFSIAARLLDRRKKKHGDELITLLGTFYCLGTAQYDVKFPNLTFYRGSKHKATILFLFLKLDQTLNTYKWPVRRETVKFVSETLKFEGNKINCFPIGQTLSDLLYSWKFWSWKYIKPRCNGGRQSNFAHNSALTWRNVIDFTMLPAQRFWRGTVSLLDVMWPRSNQ